MKILNIFDKTKHNSLQKEIEKELGLSFDAFFLIDFTKNTSTKKAFDHYDAITHFKENPEEISKAKNVIAYKNNVQTKIPTILDNQNKKRLRDNKLISKLNVILKSNKTYRVSVQLINNHGHITRSKVLDITSDDILYLTKKPHLLLSKDFIKQEREKRKTRNAELLYNKKQELYNKINALVDYANIHRDHLFSATDKEELDTLINQLCQHTSKLINNIKSHDSKDWLTIYSEIDQYSSKINKLFKTNNFIIEYYRSEEFSQIQKVCTALMTSQIEFNEYINEKIDIISHLFGSRVVRNATINGDEYKFIRPYKKTISPFTAEVSSNVFSSAENNPIEYIIKYFYPNKEQYRDQIDHLYLLIEELETLKDAKAIIESHKKELKQFLLDVPSIIFEKDESGFYSRLGFANISENILTIEYKFNYTSNGGYVQRSFSVPMTETTIIELIHLLENKLTFDAFVSEQRTLMTKKLREYIKKRDNYTCCHCGNSTYKEPNLLLEIDHIIPVSKGGRTEEANLQTLCWKCNRSKSNKFSL